MKKLKYLEHYPKNIVLQIAKLIEDKKLDKYLLSKYKTSHEYKSDKALYEYTIDIKNQFLKNPYHLVRFFMMGKSML